MFADELDEMEREMDDHPRYDFGREDNGGPGVKDYERRTVDE